MKHFEKYVCTIFGVAALLFLSGCGGGGGSGSSPYFPIYENQVGIRILDVNSFSNWHGTPVEENNISFAWLDMVLHNEQLFSPPFNVLMGQIMGYPISSYEYDGNISFMGRRFTPTVEPGRYYLGQVDIETSGIWRTPDFQDHDKKVTIDSLNDNESVLLPGKWYDVSFKFNRSDYDPSVDFRVTVEDTNITFEDYQ